MGDRSGIEEKPVEQADEIEDARWKGPLLASPVDSLLFVDLDTFVKVPWHQITSSPNP